MNSNWCDTCIGNCLQISNGKTKPSARGSLNVFGSNGIIDKCKESNTPKDTIIIGRVGTHCGSIHFSHEECWVTDNAMKAIVKGNNNAIFFYYLLKEYKLGRMRGGSGQPLLNQSIINSIEICAPPKKEQDAISDILGTFDKKIVLNQKINQTLENTAKAVFKSWFIDFDPVRAKIDDYPTKLGDEILDLFPDSFEDSDFGQIPQGWMFTQLGNCSLEIESGRRPKGGINKELNHGIPSVGAESIDSAGIFDFSKTKFITNEFASSSKKGWVRNFDVAIYKDGGKPGEFKHKVAIYGSQFPFESFMVNEHVFLLRCHELGQSFLYQLLRSNNVKNQIMQMASAKGAQPGLNQEEVKSCLFLKPNKILIEKFDEITLPIIHKQLALGKQNIFLQNLRDILVPRLISGELRISDAEKILEEMVL